MTAIGDLLQEYRELPDPGSTPPVLTLTEKNGFVKQSDRFKKRLATEDTSSYKVVRSHDIAFNPYLLWAGAIAQNTIVDEGVISPLYPTFRVRDEYHPRYVARLLLTPRLIAAYDSIAFGSVPRRRRSSTADFLGLDVPTPPRFNEQLRIARILDHADAIIRKRDVVIARFNELAEATFERAFGAKIHSPTTTLGGIADISSGITKGRRTKEPTKATRYLAVANVQAGHLNLHQVKEIAATDAEIARYALIPGDIVLTEGGDPDKLGRGTVWRGELPLCLHQNHIFRVRLRDDRVDPDYLSAYLASKPARDYFLRSAKQTTGIASINMAQLRNTPVFVPSQRVQRRYLERVRAIGAQRQAAKVQASGMGELLASLEARAFFGQL